MALGFDGSLGDDTLDGGSDAPGIALSLVVLVAGYGALVGFRGGPVATAGVVASTLGWPALFFFLTLDATDFPPFSVDALLAVSTMAWVASYLAGPGRGHAFYLGAALVGLWLFVLEQVESIVSFPFVVPFLLFGTVEASDGGGGTFDGGGASVDAMPDPSTIGAISLLFAGTYLLAVGLADRRGLFGTATPFLFASLVTLFVGVFALADDLEATGTGIVLVLVGLGLAVFGAGTGRRGTTWLGGGAVFSGATTIVGDLAGERAQVFGLVTVVVGVAVIALAAAGATAWQEPDETVGGPSPWRRR